MFLFSACTRPGWGWGEPLSLLLLLRLQRTPVFECGMGPLSFAFFPLDLPLFSVWMSLTLLFEML